MGVSEIVRGIEQAEERSSVETSNGLAYQTRPLNGYVSTGRRPCRLAVFFGGQYYGPAIFLASCVFGTVLRNRVDATWIRSDKV